MTVNCSLTDVTSSGIIGHSSSDVMKTQDGTENKTVVSGGWRPDIEQRERGWFRAERRMVTHELARWPR
jgi:hypothetical protein